MQQQLIFGRHPVLDAIRSGTVFEKLFLQQGTRGEFEKELRKLVKQFRIPVQMAPKEKLDKMTRGNHQGIIGLVALLPYYQLEDVLAGIYEGDRQPLLLVLDGVTDVRNLGAIARSAECMGVDAIVVPSKGSGQLNAEAIKSSAGALTRITVCRESSLVNAVKDIKMAGLQVVATALVPSSEQIFEVDWRLPTAIIMGSEDKGVGKSLLELADQVCIIPQVGQTDSLNVSVATGVVLYEALRQRINQ
jgi:23S rRNA (guanosine2251-2'-O)-methyltransferase